MPELKAAAPREETRPLCLEFANTVQWHAGEHPEETLHSFTDLVEWARGAGIVSEDRARRLIQAGLQQPARAEQALQRAAALREAIYRLFADIAHKRPAAEADLAELNRSLTRLTNGAQVIKTPQGFAWKWRADDEALDSFIGPAALSAAELLISEEREYVGQCADDRGCGWLFLDTSKNHSRRWCDINDCGNRAKQRRHYARKKAQAL